MTPRKVSGLEWITGLLSANLGTKLISVVIAIVLWGIVLGSRNVEVTKEIPLEVITPADVVPANEIPEKIAFRLSGPKAFLRNILDRKEEPIRVNLSGAKPALVTYRFFSDNIRVPIGVKVLSINPTAILIKLEYMKRKDVPVRAEIKGNPPEGFHLVKVELNPDVVRIKGAESRVDAITELTTTPIDVSNLKKNLEREVPLDLARFNVQLDSPIPKALIEVESIAANFKIKNVDVKVLSSFKSRVEEKNITVLVRSTPESLQSLDRSQVYGIVDLTNHPKGKYQVPIKVILPKSVGLVKVVPDHVNVTLY